MSKSSKKSYEPLAALAELAKLAVKLLPEIDRLERRVSPFWNNPPSRDELLNNPAVVAAVQKSWEKFEAERDKVVAPCALLAEKTVLGTDRPYEAYELGLGIRYALTQLAHGERANNIGGISGITAVPDRDGRIEIRQSRMPDILREVFENREISRIRECPVCHAIFIQMRVDQQACRGPCTNVHNVRLWRLGVTKPQLEKRLRKQKPAKQKLQGKVLTPNFDSRRKRPPAKRT